jgi:kinesin family protein 22
LHFFLYPFPRAPLGAFRRARIIEIDWAVKNDKAFVPSPKREKTRKVKSKKKTLRASRLREQSSTAPEGPMDVDEWQDEEETKGGATKQDKQSGKASFGLELTNSPNKRTMLDRDSGDGDVGTPFKKQRVTAAESGEWIPPAPLKKGKRNLVGSQ